MIKKLVIAGAGAMLVGGLLFGRDTCSYLKASASKVTESVKSNVPIEFEIERARQMLTDLKPEIQRNVELIAKEEVKLEQLERRIAAAESKLGKDKSELMTLKTDLAQGESVYRYAGRSYTADQVKNDLANRFARFKVNQETLDSLQQMYDARVKRVEAAQERLRGMLAARRQLDVDLEHLETRLAMVEAAQTTSEFTFDDSQLSRVKSTLQDLQTRLDVAERMVGVEDQYLDEIPVGEEAPSDILDQVTSYFNGESQSDNHQKVAVDLETIDLN